MRKLVICLAVLALTAGACGSDSSTVNDEGTPAPENPSANIQACENHTPAKPKQIDKAPKKEPRVEVPDGAPPCKLVSQDLLEGDGDAATAASTVSVNYVGVSYSSGVRFDGNWGGPQPITFPLSGVIKGWQQGIPGMKVGGVRRLIIPPDLAYGDQPPAGSTIAPGETLVFIIELRKVS